MNRIQKLDFRSVEEFMDFLPGHERKMVGHLRQIILDCLPAESENLSYNVPYYSRHSRICYIWPASVPWGNVPERSVALGFVKGHLMRDEPGLLQKGSRKNVRTLTFGEASQIDASIVKMYVFEAIQSDTAKKSAN